MTAFKSVTTFTIILASILLAGCCDIYQWLYPTASITVNNATDQSVVLFYFASQEDTEWGASVISEPILPAEEYSISDIDRRIIKVKAVLEDDQTIIKEQIDLTSSEVYILSLEVGTNEGA